MGQAAAKQGDQVTGMDTHLVATPAVPNGTPTLGLPFLGLIDGGLSSNVFIMGKPAATVGSSASNQPPHVVPVPAVFVAPPKNKGTVQAGSATVNINGKPAARNGDIALTCNDPADLPVGQVVATGTVNFG